MTEQESLSSLKVLVALARADGVLHDDERLALEHALEGAKLPAGTRLEALLSEAINLDAELANLKSDAAKESTYSAAVALAKADGACSAEEQKLLDQMKQKLSISQEKAKLFDRLFQEARDTVSISGIQAISDPEKRAAAIKEDTLKYSILSAVLGAFPVPGLAIVTDLAVVGLQAKLVRDVGQYYGQPLGGQAAKTLIASIAGGAGARIAVNNLAKFLPGFGSVVGATTSFASTWAIGRVAAQYFESGGKIELKTLRDAFKLAKKEGEKAYKENKDTVEAKQKATEERLKTLSEDLKAGRISQEDYDRQVAQL